MSVICKIQKVVSDREVNAWHLSVYRTSCYWFQQHINYCHQRKEQI